MRGLAQAGLIAIAFGLGSFYATDHFGPFSAVNLVLGGLALVAAAAAGMGRMRSIGGPHSRPVILRGSLIIVAALGLATALERAAALSQVRFDWTGEESFSLSSGIVEVCAGFETSVSATLYRDAYDPRIRRTRLLLHQIAEVCPLEVANRILDEVPEDEDRYAIGTSNSIVFVLGERFVTVERPTEGSIYEALYRLRSVSSGHLTLLRGEGEGDPGSSDATGYSGLATALSTEGYQLRLVTSAALREIPEGTDAVLLIAPRRRMREAPVEALRRYLAGGGRLIALLEPGTETGIEGLLGEYGLETPNSVLIDPASGAVESTAEGLNIVAYNYSGHPTSAGLNRNRMTFFPGVRPIVTRKVQPNDKLQGVVWSSPKAWVTDDLSVLDRRSGRIENQGEAQGYHFIMAAGRFPRGEKETRIVVFGDSDFASNRYLRALYDLDILLNSIHWAVEREAQITLRPKIRDTVQFPMPLENALRTLYGVGLLVPELMLITGAVIWIRRRSG